MSGQACEQLTLFPAASPASRSQQRESDAEQPMTVTSGRKCSVLLKNSGPLGLLARMLLASSAWQSRSVTLSWKAEALTVSQMRITTKEYFHNKNECFSTVSSKSYVDSVMKSKHLLFRLVASMRPISDIESLLWLTTPNANESSSGRSESFREGRAPTPSEYVQLFATPNTMDALPCRSYDAMKRQATNGGRKNRQRPSNLREQVDPLMCKAYTDARVEANALWPTPTVNGNNNRAGISPKAGDGLATAVKMWPTPTALDYKGPVIARTTGEKAYKSNLKEAVKIWPTPTTRDYKSADTNPQSKRFMQKTELNSAVAMYPTPSVGAPLCGGSAHYKKLQEMTDAGIITEQERSSMSAQGGGQLNPDWVEWLMGFPTGWTALDTIAKLSLMPHEGGQWPDEPLDVPRVANDIPSRADRLKCLGNAVVPQQFYPIFKAISQIIHNEVTADVK